MSLRDTMAWIRADGFPRVSGDEPAVGRAQIGDLAFSPRERG